MSRPRVIAAKPVMGDDYRLTTEARELTYRGKKYPYIHHNYEELSTGLFYTTGEIDEVNLNQVYDCYRAENGIPFEDEIADFRKHYGLTLTAISKILGIGENQYSLYEEGEVPSLSNGRLLKSVMTSPDVFRKLVEDCGGEITEKTRNKVLSRIDEQRVNTDSELQKKLIFGNSRRNRYNGYALQSVEMVHECLLLYINEHGATYKTKMNKLLFYTDFLSYKKYARGLTGLSYKAIQHGPVPNNWNKIYSAFDDINLEIVELPSGEECEKLVSEAKCDESKFTPEQLDVLNTVCNTFGKMTSKQISEISHKEKAWTENVEAKAQIDYKYAFELMGV